MLPGHVPPWVPRPVEKLKASFLLQLHWMWCGGWVVFLHYHVCFCCHWHSLRPSQSQSQTHVKTVMFRKRTPCHTTSSIPLLSPPFYWSGWASRAPSFSPPFVYSLHQGFAINCLFLSVNASLPVTSREICTQKSLLSLKERKALSPKAGVPGVYVDAVLEAKIPLR